MNKYIIRTSIFWLVLLAIVAAVFVYRARSVKPSGTLSIAVQPIASGPNSDTNNEASKPTQRWKSLSYRYNCRTSR